MNDDANGPTPDTRTAPEPTPDPMERSIDEAFAFAEQVVEHPDAFPDAFIMLSITSDTTGKLLTPERRRLLADLRDHGSHDSIAELAHCLHRDPTRVGRDLKPLIDVGLVDATPVGKNKRLTATDRPVLLR